MSNATKEITHEELMTSSDWEEVFGEGSGGNTDKIIAELPPGSDIDLAPPSRTDVAEIIAAVNGENDEASWTGVFRLKDGRFLVATGWCDYTGWDCRAGNNLAVARTLADAIRFGLSDGERARLKLPLMPYEAE